LSIPGAAKAGQTGLTESAKNRRCSRYFLFIALIGPKFSQLLGLQLHSSQIYRPAAALIATLAIALTADL
jgi:hypothetical protein